MKSTNIASGSTFGRLTVVACAAPSKRHRHFVCACACGSMKAVRSDHLIGGRIRSCGCLLREMAGLSKRTHGMTRDPEHRIWRSMLSRCHTPSDTGFKHYGAKGVNVCERWHSFENFLADMGPRPSGMSIDRWPNNAGNYEPGNCRWATDVEQQRNKRSNRRVTLNGETKCIAEWSETTGIGRSTIQWRLSRGWPPELALTQPALLGQSR